MKVHPCVKKFVFFFNFFPLNQVLFIWKFSGVTSLYENNHLNWSLNTKFKNQHSCEIPDTRSSAGQMRRPVVKRQVTRHIWSLNTWSKHTVAHSPPPYLPSPPYSLKTCWTRMFPIEVALRMAMVRATGLPGLETWPTPVSTASAGLELILVSVWWKGIPWPRLALQQLLLQTRPSGLGLSSVT